MEAARTYANDPIAFHLRGMNMLYEGLKQNSTIVIVPSSAIETMQLGGLAGMTALTMGIGQERAIKEKEAQDKIANDPMPAREEATLPLTTSQIGRLEVPAVQ